MVLSAFVLRMFELLLIHSTDHFILCCKLNNFCCSRAQMCLLTSAWRNYFLYRKLCQEVLQVCTEQQKHLERQCLWSHYYLFNFIFYCLAPEWLWAHILYIFGVYSTEIIIEGPPFITQNTQINTTNITMQQHCPYFPGLLG